MTTAINCAPIRPALPSARTWSKGTGVPQAIHWLREKKSGKSYTDVRDLVVAKISNASHNSNKKSKDFLLSYFTHMFRNDTYFAIKMKKKFDFSEAEIKYLLSESHQHKLKEILNPHEVSYLKPTEDETEVPVEKDKKEDLQQSLFDF